MKSLMSSVTNLFQQKFDTTARETERQLQIKIEQIEKKAEDTKANASNNSDNE